MNNFNIKLSLKKKVIIFHEHFTWDIFDINNCSCGLELK